MSVEPFKGGAVIVLSGDIGVAGKELLQFLSFIRGSLEQYQGLLTCGRSGEEQVAFLQLLSLRLPCCPRQQIPPTVISLSGGTAALKLTSKISELLWTAVVGEEESLTLRYGWLCLRMSAILSWDRA